MEFNSADIYLFSYTYFGYNKPSTHNKDMWGLLDKSCSNKQSTTIANQSEELLQVLPSMHKAFHSRLDCQSDYIMW